MKKYSIIGIVGLVVLLAGLATRRIYTQGNMLSLSFLNTPNKNTGFAYLPDNIDQFMAITITPDTVAFILHANSEVDAASLTDALATLDQIIIAQSSTASGDVYAGVILEGNEHFSIDQIKALGLLYFDTGYEAKELAPNIRLYANQETFDYFAQSKETLIHRAEVKNLLHEADVSDGSILFYSRPNSESLTSPFGSILAQKLVYTAMYGNPTATSSSGKFVLQFSGTEFKLPETIFTPRYASKLNSNSLLYLEGRDLLKTFGITDTQFSFGLPMLLGQTLPGIENLLSNEQTNVLYQSLNNRLGIILELSDGPFGLGAHLLFSDPKIYDILTTLRPAWKALADNFAGGTGVQLKETTTDNSRGIVVEFPSITDNSATGEQATRLPLLQITKDADSTSLNLMSNALSTTQGNGTKLTYSADSLLTFRIDPTVMNTPSAQINPFVANVAGQINSLGTGIIMGELGLDEKNQQLIITFETK